MMKNALLEFDELCKGRVGEMTISLTSIPLHPHSSYKIHKPEFSDELSQRVSSTILCNLNPCDVQGNCKTLSLHKRFNYRSFKRVYK